MGFKIEVKRSNCSTANYIEPMKDCNNCELLIKRYGYCPIVEEWVEPQLNIFSFSQTIVKANNG